jgi:hypothetical protein
MRFRRNTTKTVIHSNARVTPYHSVKGDKDHNTPRMGAEVDQRAPTGNG